MKKILLIIFSILLFPNIHYGQSPGGVSTNLQLWYKGDAGVTLSGTNNVTQWDNSASSSYNLIQQGTAGTVPSYNAGNANQINFNPSVRFDGVDDRLYTANVPQNITTSSSAPYTTSQYIVYRKLGNNAGTIYSHSNGSGGTWNIGAGTNGNMLVTNRSLTTSAPVANEVRLQGIDGSSNAASSYLNGEPKSTNFSGGAATSGTQSFWLGAQGTNSFSNTDIAEVVIYNTAQSNRERIESYLCLKYGIGKLGNYTASNGTTMYWNAGANTSYSNNVAGIGRDSGSGVYQKQSMSQSSGSQVLIGLQGMADTNAANTGSLNDNQYLMWGDNGLIKALRVPLSHTVSGIEINSRFGSIWKVQNTGNVGMVRVMWPVGIKNLHLVQSTDETISDTDTFIAMTATQTINGVTYNYADVSLADGQYFTFAGYGNSPGGVMFPTVWLKANEGVNTDNNGLVQEWINQGTAISLPNVSQTTLNNRPDLLANGLNFNPAVYHQGANRYLLNTSGVIGSDIFNSVTEYSHFTVSKSLSGSTVWNYGNRGGTSYIGYEQSFARARFFQRNSEISVDNTSGVNAFDPASALLLSSSNRNGNVYFNFSNGQTNTLAPSTGNVDLSNPSFRIGTTSNGFVYQGSTPEIIIYGRSLSDTEQAQVRSYLAIKYGMSLGKQDLAYNYVNSQGIVIWNGVGNTAYNNNIAGIGRDDFSLLYQKQSMSSNSGSQVVIGLSGMADTNIANTGTLADHQYLIWGDNGLKKSLSVVISGINDVNFRFASIWKVQNTGNVGTVRIMWPVGIKNIKLIQNTDASFTIGNVVTDMSGNTQVINGVTYNYADVSITDGQYFTFAGYGYAPGGVLNALQTWYRADDGVSGGAQWNDQVQGKNVIQPTSSRQPTLTQSSSTFNFNFNPYFDFNRGANQKMWLENPNILGAGFTGGSIYTVSRRNPSNNGMDQTIAGFGDDNPNLQASNQTSYRLYLNNGPGVDSYNVGNLMYTANGAHMHWNNSGSNILEHNGIQVPGSNRSSTPGGTFVIGGEGTASGTGGGENWNGGIGEVIVYDQNLTLTPAENIKVNSYLALKYGFTLGNSATVANYDYISSVGVKIWDSSLNTPYNKNIFGIGRDDISVLHQKVSASVNSGTILAVSTNNNFVLSNLDASRTGLSGDSTFLLFGDNNDTSTLPYTPAEIGDCGEVIGGENQIKLIPRKWMVQRTGQIGSTYLQANLSAYSGGINTGIFMLVADDANFTQNVVKVPGSQGTGGNWVFSYNFDNSNAQRYITFGGEFEAGSCETCKGGTYTLRTGNQWNTNATPWANQISNKKENILLGTDAEGTPLYASMYADYSVDPSIEYNPNRYPVRYGGRWAISRRYDNTNAKVKHTIQLTKAMKASFQLSNINTYRNNKNNFEVIGYCGGVPVMPKITYGYNTSYHTFTIDGNKTTGTMSWRGFTPNVSTANVRFDRPVERIVIICSVDRVNTQKTLRSVTYSDITLECQEAIEPTPDNVYVSHSFTQNTLSTCGGDTTMRIKVTNNNICDDKIINLTQTLPAGLSFANGSFNNLELPAGALDNATVSISGNTFSITGLKIPQGEYWMYVDIANPGTAGTYATQFNYQVANGITPAANYQSSVVNLVYYQADPLPPSPILKQTIKEVVSGAVSCGKNNIQITYRMKINNVNSTPLTGAEILQAFDYDQTIVAVNYVNNEDQNGVVTGEYATDGSGNPIQPVGSALYSLSNATIPVGISYIDITVNVGNSYDIAEVQNMGLSAAFQIGIDPGGECAENSSSSSNETILKWCGPYCVKPGASGTPLISTRGISTKLNPNVNNWPASTPNGHLVLDAVNKGLVITHMTTEQINALVPVKGMIVYDTTEGRVKIYRGNNTDNKPVIDEGRYGWQPITRSCNDQ